jgi:NAD(P)-dependent dehydrogenase (short-subunit alcohol dehydrogenase family)
MAPRAAPQAPLTTAAEHLLATSSTSPPGPVLQYFNRLAHRPPFSFLFYGIYWSIFLTILSPLAGLLLVYLTLFKLIRYIVLLPFGLEEGRKIQPSEGESDVRYGVVISGCDSGFGCDLAHELARRRFVVFAGCLTREAMEQYEDVDNIVPIKMDVTKQGEVNDSVAAVMNWLAEATIKGEQRHLHAVVNNAGVGTGGRVDWLIGNIKSSYGVTMEVNYFGMIRTTQAFLPILKTQAIARTYETARIINMVSMAGLMAMGDFGPYNGSKFAAEAFSTALRHELWPFGIQVATVNPSFHSSPLTQAMGPRIVNNWISLDEDTRKEFGEAFFRQQFHNNVEQPRRVMWDASNVRDRLVHCVEALKIPAQVPVGLDAMYSILATRHLPIWAQDKLLYAFARSRKVKPTVMER